LKWAFPKYEELIDEWRSPIDLKLRRAPFLPLVAALVLGGIAINWFVHRGEVPAERMMLSHMPRSLGEWHQKGDEIRFDESVENVLKTSDYSMREYTLPNGRVANLYIGYYSTQRTGATYHSPRNCLPGAGWVMSDPQIIEITMPGGDTFEANRYVIENGKNKEVMIYWYQGRGRIEAVEYRDKMNTVWDSVTRRRTDGAIIRVMTGLGSDETESYSAASDLAAQVAAQITPFVPN
jgi:EpsI family protein